MTQSCHTGPMGPNLSPGPFWDHLFFIFWMARGASLANLGHFTKFRPRPVLKDFPSELTSHLPLGGLTLTKNMQETFENLLNPSQNPFPGTQQKNPRENFAQKAVAECLRGFSPVSIQASSLP